MMPNLDDSNRDVDRFLLDQIDTVPHLEALLLVWKSHPRLWSVDDMAKALFLARDVTKAILDDLVRRRLISLNTAVTAEECYGYESESTRDDLMAAVAATYRRELIRITRLIHSKPSASIREFARAFRLKKEGE
jgi:hypothetical protein